MKERAELRRVFEQSGRVQAVFNGHLHWNHLDVIAGHPVRDGPEPHREPRRRRARAARRRRTPWCASASGGWSCACAATTRRGIRSSGERCDSRRAWSCRSRRAAACRRPSHRRAPRLSAADRDARPRRRAAPGRGARPRPRPRPATSSDRDAPTARRRDLPLRPARRHRQVRLPASSCAAARFRSFLAAADTRVAFVDGDDLLALVNRSPTGALPPVVRPVRPRRPAAISRLAPPASATARTRACARTPPSLCAHCSTR